jgi:hypothetical protein
MTALSKFLVLLALFLLASHENALSSVPRNQVWVIHLIQLWQPMSNPTNEPSCDPFREPTKQMDLDAELPYNLSSKKTQVVYSKPKQDAGLSSKITDLTNTQTCGPCHNKSEPESFADQPGIDEEVNHPIAATNSSQNQWQMPTPINLDSSGLWQPSKTEVSATTMTNQNAHLCFASPQITHLRSASPQSSTSARVLFSTFRSVDIGLLSMVYSLAVKVQASSTPKVSPHAFALLAFEPVPSTNQNSSATIALKAIEEMQVSADSKRHVTPSEHWHMSNNVSTKLNPSFS